VVTARDRFAVRRRPHHSGARCRPAGRTDCCRRLVVVVLSNRRQSPAGKKGWGTILGIGIVANLGYMCSGLWPPTRNSPSRAFSGFFTGPWRGQWVFPQNCMAVGRLLGEKLILTEFVAYSDLATYLALWDVGSSRARSPVDRHRVLRTERFLEFCVQSRFRSAGSRRSRPRAAAILPAWTESHDRRSACELHACLRCRAFYSGSSMLVSSSRDRPASLFCWRDRVNAVLTLRNEGACTDIYRNHEAL